MQHCSFLFSLVLFLSTQSTFCDDAYLDLSKDRSSLAEIVAEISSWDDDTASALWHLNKYIAQGYTVALKDAVLETLAYAEFVVEEQCNKISPDQLDNINNALNVLARKIDNGDLAVHRSCGMELNCDDDQTFDCFFPSSACCQGPRGPRGHRGHRGHRGATGATGAFPSSCIDNLCVDNLTVNNCMSSLCVNTLSVVTETISGPLTTCDVFVGCDLFLNDSINPAIGNVIKAGQRFIHTSPAGRECTYVGESAGNFTSPLAQFNSGFGFNALTSVTDGISNTAIGAFALASNTTGIKNVGVGNIALQANVSGVANTAIGDAALGVNLEDNNTAVGASAMRDNTTGIENTAIGTFALQNNVSGSLNTVVGFSAQVSPLETENNVVIGDNTLADGSFNVIVGSGAGNVGSNNVGVGAGALFFSNADQNVAVGSQSMGNTISANGNNTAIGFNTFPSVSGSFNIAIGSGAGVNSTLTSSDNNIYIANSGANESGIIRIGTFGTQTECFIQGIHGVTTGLAAIGVLVDGNGQLGTISSTRRVKHDIQDMDADSAHIHNLRPVTFVYNGDASETRQYGLIAEEVDQVFPAIVVKDADGNPYTVQYQVLPVLLLNEVQKLYVGMEQQRVAIENMNSRLIALEQQN